MIRFENRRQEIWTFPKHSNLNIYDLKKIISEWVYFSGHPNWSLEEYLFHLFHYGSVTCVMQTLRRILRGIIHHSVLREFAFPNWKPKTHGSVYISIHSVGPNLSISMHMQTHCWVVNSPAIHLSEISVFISWMLNLHKLRYAYARNCVKTCCR